MKPNFVHRLIMATLTQLKVYSSGTPSETAITWIKRWIYDEFVNWKEYPVKGTKLGKVHQVYMCCIRSLSLYIASL